MDIFRRNGTVQIFSEGKCVNEWHLRPLKKGTARLAISSWENNIPLNVLPVGINYSAFRKFGKNIYINFGEIISKEDILSVRRMEKGTSNLITCCWHNCKPLFLKLGKRIPPGKKKYWKKVFYPAKNNFYYPGNCRFYYSCAVVLTHKTVCMEEM